MTKKIAKSHKVDICVMIYSKENHKMEELYTNSEFHYYSPTQMMDKEKEFSSNDGNSS